MEKDIIDGKIGTVGSYDIEFKGGYLSGSIEAGAPFGLSGKFEIKIGADAVITAIEKAIPGQIDDAILELLKSLLKA